jgi:predicted NodU family carbamoyl transferase
LIDLLKQHGWWNNIARKTIFVNHHDAHAASAFFCSPFDDAAVMVVDSAGQKAKLTTGLIGVETETFYRGDENGLHQIVRNHAPVNQFNGWLLNFSGIGNLYSQVTYFLGFGKHEEGKTMGLASYGMGRFISEIPEEQFLKKIGQSSYISPTRLEPHPETSLKYLFKKTSYSRRSALIRQLKLIAHTFSKRGLAYEKPTHFPKTPEIFFEYPRANKKTEIPDNLYPHTQTANIHDYQEDNRCLSVGVYTELAYWAQFYLEKVMVDYATYLHNVTKSKNLCIAGGVGLNSVANKKILDNAPFENIFIQPASGDSGLALGTALWASHQIKKNPVKWRMDNAYLGRDYDEKEILDAISGSGCNYKKLENPQATAAKLLADEKIIGWFQGKSEYGPRALGNRSILCSPIPSGMKDKLNMQVKHRESFRPFAPACLQESAGEYFKLDCPSPFMLLIARVKKDNVPAITHVDGTARVQTVNINQNPKFYSLIKEFQKLTGVPVVLNTSFNDSGEPIVETPKDAVRTFKSTNLDALIMGDYLIKN